MADAVAVGVADPVAVGVADAVAVGESPLPAAANTDKVPLVEPIKISSPSSTPETVVVPEKITS